MKPVSGRIVSTKPVSLSKAAKILNNFVLVNNGASQPVSVYLRRTSASFNELVQFHKELKPSHSNRIQKKHRRVELNDGSPIKTGKNPKEVQEDRVDSVEDGVRNRERKMIKSEGVETEGGGSLGIEEERRKKRTSGQVDDGEIVDLIERSGLKNKKRRRIEGDD